MSEDGYLADTWEKYLALMRFRESWFEPDFVRNNIHLGTVSIQSGYGGCDQCYFEWYYHYSWQFEYELDKMSTVVYLKNYFSCGCPGKRREYVFAFDLTQMSQIKTSELLF